MREKIIMTNAVGYTQAGYLRGFGIEYEENREGNALHYSVAIVEYEDGRLGIEALGDCQIIREVEIE